MNLTRKPQTLGAVAVGVALAVTLSACGGGGASNAASTSPTTGGSSGSSGSGARLPGTSGQIAAITGSSMEVQNPQNGQVTVNWTSSTRFSKTVTVSVSSVAAGACVNVVGSNSGGQVTADTVTISQPDSSGSCTARVNGTGGGGGTGFGGGFGGGFRNGAPPSGSVPNPPAGAGNFGFARGKVTSVSPTALVIYGTSSSGTRPRGSTTSTSVPDTSLTVQLTSSTRYVETQTAGSSDLVVNDCVTAAGATDSTGAVTANTIRISSPGPNGCTIGFGGRGLGGGGFGGGAAAGNG